MTKFQKLAVQKRDILFTTKHVQDVDFVQITRNSASAKIETDKV